MLARIVPFLEQELTHYLHDLETLVSIDSGSDDIIGINRINDWLEVRLRALGFQVARHPHAAAGDDLVASISGRGTLRVVLLGHSDTVFPHGTAAQRPFSMEGDVIRGPGTCDMKSGLLTGLYAAAALRALNYDDFHTITYLCVSDEEMGQRHSPPLIRACSRNADVVLTLEAARANGDIVTARKGTSWYTIEARGRAAHAGVEPEKGCNAVLALARYADAIDRLNDPARAVTVNIGALHGGTLPNIVPAQAQMQVDVRAFSDAELQEMEAKIAAILAQERVPGVTVQYTIDSVSPPMERTPAVAALEGLARRVAAELGFTLNGASTGGAADSAFAAIEGIPVLDGLGPIGGLDHGPDEYILQSSIVPRTGLLAGLIMKMAQEGIAPAVG